MKSNIDIVREFYQSLAGGDVPAVMALLAPTIEWTEAEKFPYFAGTWRTPEAVVKGLFEPLGRDWTGFAVKPETFLAQADDVVGFGRYVGTYRRTGRSMTAPFAHRWTVRGGKIVGFVQYTDTAKVLEAIA